jgi:hypothetical protein
MSIKPAGENENKAEHSVHSTTVRAANATRSPTALPHRPIDPQADPA